MFVIPIKVLIVFLGPIQTGGSGKEGMWRELSHCKVVSGEATTIPSIPSTFLFIPSVAEIWIPVFEWNFISTTVKPSFNDYGSGL